MANTDIKRAEITQLISAIKIVGDTPKSLINKSSDPYKDPLGSTDGIVKKTVTDFTSRLKGGTQNKKDIFDEVVSIANSFIGTDKEDPVNPKTKPLVQSKIFRYAKEAARKTLQSSIQIISTETRKTFFGGTGLCNSVTTLGQDSLTIAPKEIDFMDMLKVDPESVTGKLMYESTTPNVTGDIKFNTDLYSTFTAPDPYNFTVKNGGNLFTMMWDSGEQKYMITNLASTTRITDFLDNYYNSIEFPDIDHILKTAMYMILGGSEKEPSSVKTGTKNLNRLTTKLFSICGKPTTDKPLLNTTDTELTEDETDTEKYFDFDDIEGIDLDDEDGWDRRVLKFVDCNNFETELNSIYPEDFTYLLDKEPIDENVINTINKAAVDAYEKAESGLALEGFQLSLLGKYIKRIPRALVSALLSPKIFFPIVVSYKLLKGLIMTAKEIMKALYNLFFNMVKSVFWKFMREFWGLIKKDLLNFVKKIAAQILMNKLKKIKVIIQALINIIKRVLKTDIGSCADIFNAILRTITSALNKSIKIPIPGPLLILSELLPGFSSDRAYMNIVERAQAAGINMGPIYGSENKLPQLIKSIVDGYSEEVDTNSYIKVALKSAVIGAGTNGYGVIAFAEGVGKQF